MSDGPDQDERSKRRDPFEIIWPSRRWLLGLALSFFLLGTLTFAATSRMSRTQSVIKQDGLAYFLYTRSLVVDADWELREDLKPLSHHFNESATEAVQRYARVDPKTGSVGLPWPIGISLPMAPFYAVGLGVEWLLAAAQGRAVNSYGPTLQFAYAYGCLFYAAAGLFLLFQVCRALTSQLSAFVAVGAIFAGGPLVFYTFLHPTMSHTASFFFVTVLLWCWLRAWQDPGRHAFSIGLVIGLLLAIRYQNVMFGVLPASLVVRDLLRRSKSGALASGLSLLGFLVGFGPQIWHLATLAAPQGNADASGGVVVADNAMHFGSPHFFQVLFSCQHGAFYWAPTLLIGAVGLLVALRVRTHLAVLVGSILGHTYLIGTLEDINWSAAAAFGMRYLVECGAFFAVGLALVFERPEVKKRFRWVLGVLVALAAFNGALSIAYTLRTIDQVECVTYGEMFRGVARILSR